MVSGASVSPLRLRETSWYRPCPSTLAIKLKVSVGPITVCNADTVDVKPGTDAVTVYVPGTAAWPIHPDAALTFVPARIVSDERGLPADAWSKMPLTTLAGVWLVTATLTGVSAEESWKLLVNVFPGTNHSTVKLFRALDSVRVPARPLNRNCGATTVAVIGVGG